jgi:hypothetical protein
MRSRDKRKVSASWPLVGACNDVSVDAKRAGHTFERWVVEKNGRCNCTFRDTCLMALRLHCKDSWARQDEW